MTFGGGGTNRVRIQIVGDKTDLDKKIRSSEKDIKDSGSRMTRGLRANAANIKAGLAVVAVAIVGIAKVSIGRAEEMNSAYAITEQVIKQTGGAANLTAEEIKELSKAQAFNTGINKAAITEGNNILLTFKNIRTEVGEGNNIFQRASAAMLDMSTVMGTDAKAGAVQLGKALNDPITGISALARVGVTFTVGQKEQIRNFQEAGDLMSAQKIILAELESQMGGTAEAAADDSAKIARSFDEITESLGQKLLPVLAELATTIPRVLGQITRLQAVALDIGADPKSVEAVTAAVKDLDRQMDILGQAPFGDEFADVLHEILNEAELTIPQLIELNNNVDTMTQTFDLSGKEAETLADIIRDQLIRDTFGTAREPLQNFATDVSDVTDAFGLTREPLQNFATDVKKGTEAADEATTSTEELAQAVEVLKVAEERAGRATDAAKDAIISKREALLGIHNPILRAAQLTDDMTEAEENLNTAIRDFGADSAEAREAARRFMDVQTEMIGIMKDLKTDGIDPTGAAARVMFQDLGIPDEVIDAIFADFEEAARRIEGRTIHLGIAVPSFDIRGENVVRTGTNTFVGHTGGRINAPRGQEVLARVLGGEEISNPAHSNGGSGTTVVVNGFVGSELALAAEIDRLLTRRSRSSPLGFQ